MERAAIVVALLQHGTPGKPRLRTFQAEKLEECAIVVQRHTPFGVVIRLHQLTVGRPMAADA
jgi:hypothetical protein